MSNKVSEYICNILFVLSVGVSLYFFGLAYSFWVSLTFIIYIYGQKSLQRVVSSGICVLAPFVLSSAKDSILKKYHYEILIDFINGIFNKYSVNYTITKDLVDTILVYLLLFVVATIFFREDNTTIGRVSPGGNPEFKEKTFIERQDDFCKSLLQRIESINRQNNWNNALYVPIETEVELTKGHRIRRYEDLLKCLKRNKNKSPIFIKYVIKRIRRSRLCKVRLVNKLTSVLENRLGDNVVYLVLGDPGSGKSVSLRKLCSELLNETHVTGKLPVYISLQTWTPDTGEWSENNLPTKIDLVNYIKSELYKEGDLFTHSFLDDYFELMLEDGRLYLIFDSFDEMPCLMGGDNNSRLIRHISELIHDFLTGPNQNGGIIASRLYNRPSDFLEQTYTLRLQKFDNSRIRKMMRRYLSVDINDIILKLFKDRIDLVELCRNPFHLSLLIDYLKKNKHALPVNQFELFKDFLEGRIEESHNQIIREGFTKKEIYEAAITLSVMMQKDKNYGLDYPINRIELSCKKFDKERWRKCITVLIYAKICRSGGNNQTVSFVHRRFQEFFYVEAIINGEENVTQKDYAGILDNTGMRDALVLYCQIAQKERIENIIDFCCDTLKNDNTNICGDLRESSVGLLNSLYFLIEAFSNRKEILQEKKEIIVGLRKYLKRETHYIILMAIVNSITLLDADDIQQMIIDVFRLHNRWLNTLMVSKCQLIKRLNRRTEISFCQFLEGSSIIDLFKNFINIDFSLSLSECFAYIRNIHKLLPGVYLSRIIIVSWFLANIFPTVKKGVVFIILFFKERIYNINGPIYRSTILNFDSILQEIRTVYVRQPQSVVRHIMGLGLYILSIAVIAITFSEMIVLMSKKFDLKIRNDRTLNIRILKRFLKVILQVFLFSRNYSEKKDMKNKYKPIPIPLLDTTFLIMPLYYVYYFYPIGPMLLIIIILQCYLTVYYLYRMVHEIIIPVYKNWHHIEYMLKLIFQLLPVCIFCLVLFDAIGVLMIGILLTLLLYGIPVLVCLLFGLDLSKETIITIGALFPLFIIAFLIVILLSSVAEDFINLFLIRVKIDKIGRDEVIKSIKKLNYRFAKCVYVDRLMNNDVELYGSWPEDYNILINDDIVIRKLAIWDCKELSLDNIYEDVM